MPSWPKPDALRARLAHIVELWRVGRLGAWLVGAYALASLFVFLRDEFWRPTDPEKWRIIALIPSLSLAWWLSVMGFLIVIWVFEASFQKQKGTLDAIDLQRLLGGMFIGTSFLYGSELTLGKHYENGFEVERLKDGFDTIPVRAPRNSVAKIRLRFFNGRGAGDQLKFLVRDGREREFEVADIYAPVDVRLDSASQFALHLVTSDGYPIDEFASLLVSVESWRR